MPSVSPEQQRLMGMAYALKKGEMDPKDASDKVKQLADGMTLKQLKDFASTKHSEMKEHAMTSYERFINEDYARVHPNPGMNVGGMGPIVIPEVGNYASTGSGDIPAPYSSRDKKLMKRRKKGVTPVKFAETDFKTFENLTCHEEGRAIMETIERLFSNDGYDFKLYESGVGYTRILEKVMPMNEDSAEYYQLTESEKDALDDVIWESIYNYAMTDDINESFFGPIISAAKGAGKAGLAMAKKVVTKVGGVLKVAKEYVIAGLVASVKAGKEAGAKGVSTIKQKAQEKADKIKSSAPAESIKKDLANLKETVNHILQSIPGLEKKGEATAKELVGDADKEDYAQAMDSITKAEVQLSNESLLHVGMARAINELKNGDSLDFINSILEDAESGAEEILKDVEAKKEDSTDQKVDSVKKSHKVSMMTIIHVLVSGVVVFIESAIKTLFKYGFKGLSVIVKRSGGPGVFEFAAIATLIAAVTALFFEYASNIVGVEWVEKVAHALHATSAAPLLGHAAEHAIPGAATIIKLCCAVYVIYVTVQHLSHAGGDHGEEGHKEEPAQA